MCDPLRWKQKTYCYCDKKIRSVKTVKWERYVPKAEAYWRQFCQDRENELYRVRKHSYPNSSNYSSHPTCPLHSNSDRSNRANIANSSVLRESESLVNSIAASRLGKSLLRKSVNASVEKNASLREEKEEEKRMKKTKKTKKETAEVKEKGTLEDAQFLKYSATYAHKALERFVRRRKLRFQLQRRKRKRKIFPALNGNCNSSTEENQVSSRDPLKSYEGSRSHLENYKDTRERRETSPGEEKLSEIDRSTLIATEETTKVPSTTTTCDFNVETARSSTSRRSPIDFFAKLPKMSYLPCRRKIDKCLPCVYESLEKLFKPLKRIDLQTAKVQTPSLSRQVSTRSDSGVSSIELKDYREKDDIPLIATNGALRAADFENYLKTAKAISKKKGAPGRQMAVDLSDTSASRTEAKEESRKSEYEDRKGAKISQDRKAMSKSLPILPSHSKVSHSSASYATSEEEEENSSVVLANDSYESKYFVPCHAPTVLCHSLEPLRALRWRKLKAEEATPSVGKEKALLFNDTIEQNREVDREKTSVTRKKDGGDEEREGKRDANEEETSTKGKEDAKEKGNGGEKAEKEAERKKKVAEGKGRKVEEKRGDSATISSKRTLTKVKSLSENLTFDSNGEVKERTALRRCSSCSNFQSIPQELPATAKFALSPAEDVREPAQSNSHKEEIDLAKILQNSGRLTKEQIARLSKDLQDENLSRWDALRILCDASLERLLKSNGNADVKLRRKRIDLIKNTVKLLVDSCRYLNADKYSSHLVFSSKQPPLKNMRRLRHILSVDTFNSVAPLLGMPEWCPRRGSSAVKALIVHSRGHAKSDSSAEAHDDLIVHPPTRKDAKAFEEKRRPDLIKYNPYSVFTRKPKRKVITWRPLTAADLEDYDPEATLHMRAEHVTNKICKDFCNWLRSLGGSENRMNEETLKDMFEINFSAEVCKATQITIEEMPMVPNEVACARMCHEATELATTKRRVMRDLKAEKQLKHTTAFGRSLPLDLRILPPRNGVQEKWLECKYVPSDLESMETVWKGITHLESVRGFIKSLDDRPEISLPPVLLEPVVVRKTEDDEEAPPDEFAHFELDIEQITSFKVE